MLLHSRSVCALDHAVLTITISFCVKNSVKLHYITPTETYKAFVCCSERQMD